MTRTAKLAHPLSVASGNGVASVTRSDFKDPGFGKFSGMPREFVLRDPGANLWEGIRDDAVEIFGAQ